MTKKTVVPIADIVKSVFTRIEGEKNFIKEDIEASWREVGGEAANRHSKPVALKRKTLVVHVDSPAWIQELIFKKRELLKALKRKLGKDKISEIQFKIGELDAKNSFE